MMNPEGQQEEGIIDYLERKHSISFGIGKALSMDERFDSFNNPNQTEDTAVLINLPEEEPTELLMETPSTSEEAPSASSEEAVEVAIPKKRRLRMKNFAAPQDTKLQFQLHLLKRFVFVFTVLFYILTFLLCLFL